MGTLRERVEELWNELNPGERAKYNKQARAQAQRYDAEMREYKSIEKKAVAIREELEDLGWPPSPPLLEALLPLCRTCLFCSPACVRTASLFGWGWVPLEVPLHVPLYDWQCWRMPLFRMLLIATDHSSSFGRGVDIWVGVRVRDEAGCCKEAPNGVRRIGTA